MNVNLLSAMFLQGLWNVKNVVSGMRNAEFATLSMSPVGAHRPLALRGHVTNASFKQRVGILLTPKIDKAHNNYHTTEI